MVPIKRRIIVQCKDQSITLHVVNFCYSNDIFFSFLLKSNLQFSRQKLRSNASKLGLINIWSSGNELRVYPCNVSNYLISPHHYLVTTKVSVFKLPIFSISKYFWLLFKVKDAYNFRSHEKSSNCVMLK